VRSFAEGGVRPLGEGGTGCNVSRGVPEGAEDGASFCLILLGFWGDPLKKCDFAGRFHRFWQKERIPWKISRFREVTLFFARIIVGECGRMGKGVRVGAGEDGGAGRSREERTVVGGKVAKCARARLARLPFGRGV